MWIKNEETCEWTYDDYDECWETECNNAFCLIAGTPKDNRMRFCPFCGKKIKECLI